MKNRVIAFVCVLATAQFAAAQLPKIKIPGTNKRIDVQRRATGTPSVTGISGACKNGGTRDVVIKVANVSPDLLANVKVTAHPPFEVVSAQPGDGEVSIKVKGAAPSGPVSQYVQYQRGPDRCDFTLKFFKNPGDQNPQQEMGASAMADASDEFVAQQAKQQAEVKAQQEQAAASMAQAQEAMKKAQPAMQAHQKASVGDKWTVKWASGKTETWNFSGMDSMTNMAVFKGPSGDVKIMYAGMYYTIMAGQCAMMAQPEGTGKVSGKTMSGQCANSGEFTAAVE